MAKKVIKLTNWVGGLNCATDPRDIGDSQFAQSWNLIDDRGGILRKVGGAVDSIVNLDFDNTHQKIGYGLHSASFDSSIDSEEAFNGTFDDGIERGTLQAYTGGTPSVTLAAASTYLASADYDNNNYFNDWTILLTSGNGAGQTRTITDYDGTSKVATIDDTLSGTPNSATKYVIFRWKSTSFGTSGAKDWITNQDGSGDFPDTDGSSVWEVGNYHLITTKTGITDHQSTEMGYVELKPSADSGPTLNSLTIKPGILYNLSFAVKSSRQFYGYVADGVHCDRAPFITLHSTSTAYTDNTGATTTGQYLFSNNSWVSSSNSTSNVQDNYITNGDFETGTGTGGTGSGPTSWTRVGTSITCSYLTSNQYGANGNTLQLAAGSGLLVANIATEIITDADNRLMTTSTTPDWAEFDESGTMGGAAHTLSGDILTITGTSATSDEGTQLAVAKMTTLIVGRTYKVSASIYSTTSTEIGGVKIALGGDVSDAFTITEATGPKVKFLTVTDASATLKIYFETNSTVPWVVDNVTISAVDPDSFVYQDLTLPEEQWYDLNFIHSSSANGINYAVIDVTNTEETKYLIPWTETDATGAITTYKFLNERTDSLNFGGNTSTEYENFYVPVNAAAATRTIRIAFSCGAASTNCGLDGVTVFKAWNDLVTMSSLSKGYNPFTSSIESWSNYSTKFKLNENFSETNDWVLRVYGGRAGWQDGATSDVDSRTVEIDNIRLHSNNSDELLFLNDNRGTYSNINIYSYNSKKWDYGLIQWRGLKSKPVYTNVAGAVKISDANFDNANTNKLFFLNNRTVMGKYSINEYEVKDSALCSNPRLTYTQALDNQYFATVYPGIEGINTFFSGLDYSGTNWKADKAGTRMLIRYIHGQNADNDYGNFLFDPDSIGTPQTSKGCYHLSNARLPLRFKIPGNSGGEDMGSVLASGGDIAKVEYSFTYEFCCPKRSGGSNASDSSLMEDKPGPKFHVSCGETTTGNSAQIIVDSNQENGPFDHRTQQKFGQEDWDNEISIKESSTYGTAYGLDNAWQNFGNLSEVGDGDKFRVGEKTCEGVFYFERGDIAKTSDISFEIDISYWQTVHWGAELYDDDSHGSSNWYDGPARFETIKLNYLNIHAYDSNYTEVGDALNLSDGNEVRVNWGFGTPSGALADNWEGRKFDVGVSSVNIFDEENWITQGEILNEGVAPSGTTYLKLGEGSDGSSNITGGQAPTVTLYMGNSIAKDTFRKLTKIYLKDNNSDIWFLQFYIDHETSKIHSTTSGYSSMGTTSNSYNVTSWQIAREDMLSFNQINSYESETLLPKTYLSSEKGGLTCRYKASVVTNNRLYVGNIMQNGKKFGDRMIVSPINKYNILPDSNFIDVATNDGDEITALSVYKDKLLQFKKKKVFIINTSGDYEFLENTLQDIGVDQQCQVAILPFGIAWVNEQGCFLYNGKEVNNLIDGKIAPTSDATFIGNNYWNIESDDIPTLGYIRDKKTLLVIRDTSTIDHSTPEGYQYNFVTKSWTFLQRRLIDSGATSHNGYKSNILTDKDGELIWYSKYSTSYSKIVKWNDGPQNNLDTVANDLSTAFFRTRDYDFGEPSVRKKIYKVYVTYQCTDPAGSAANSKVLCKFATNGSNTFTAFSDNSTNYAAATGLTGSDGWATAILVPSSSINNVYSFALQFGEGTAIPSGFEINDISIVYRIKKPK